MDKNCFDAFQDLNRVHRKVSSLFQDLWKEKNEYKEELEKLKVQSNKVSEELIHLKKQNSTLKTIILKCVKLLNEKDFTNKNLAEDYKIIQGMIEQNGLNVKESPKDLPLNSPNGSIESVENKKNSKGTESLQEAVKKGKEAKKQNQNASQHFFRNWGSEKNYRKSKENKGDELNVPETVEFGCDESILQNSSASSSRGLSIDLSDGSRSPIFRSSSFGKPEMFPGNENDKEGRNYPKVVKESLFTRTMGLFISPSKRKSNDIDNFSPKKLLSTPKRFKRRRNVNSPVRSPVALQLKNSNVRESVISNSGTKNLTQTILNVNAFQSKNLGDKKTMDGRNNLGLAKIDEAEVSMEAEEDDFILESPKSNRISLQESEMTKSEINLKELENSSSAPAAVSGIDLDETYVTPQLIRNYKSNSEKSFRVDGFSYLNPSPPHIEKSPEFDDSVGFPQERSPVGDKSEGMKLPGQTCMQCKNAIEYYKDVFGENEKEEVFKKALNKCSRHRFQMSPEVEETPPGYWKPFLTATAMSPDKNDDFR